MEFLSHVIAALLILPIIGGAAWLIEFAGLLVFGLFMARTRALRDRWRRTMWMLSMVLSAGLLGLLCIDLFFFESCVRFAVHRIEQRSDITIDFREAHGSLLFGRVELDAAHIKIRDRLDVTVDEAELDVSMLGFLRFGEEVPIDLVRVKGLRGTVSYQKSSSKASRPFRIERLELEDLDLRIEDPRLHVLQVPVRFLPPLVVSPLRSNELMWDMLCHSTSSVEVFGVKLIADNGWGIKGISPNLLTSQLHLPSLPAVAAADVLLTCPTEDKVDLGLSFHPTKRWLDRLTPDLEYHVTLTREQLREVTHVGQLWDGVRNSWGSK